MCHREAIKLTHYDETKKMVYDSDSNGGPSSRQSGTNPPMKALQQSCHWVEGMNSDVETIL